MFSEMVSSHLNASFLPTAWTPVKRGVNIPFDLEGTPLQIRTNSTAGSGDHIWLHLYDAQDGFIFIRFTSPMQYSIGYCTTSWPDLPTQPPHDVDKIWTFTKTNTSFIISCNGVDVLNYTFSDSSRSECVPHWSRDVENIKFDGYHDEASDYYRPLPTGQFFVFHSTY